MHRNKKKKKEGKSTIKISGRTTRKTVHANIHIYVSHLPNPSNTFQEIRKYKSFSANIFPIISSTLSCDIFHKLGIYHDGIRSENISKTPQTLSELSLNTCDYFLGKILFIIFSLFSLKILRPIGFLFYEPQII